MQPTTSHGAQSKSKKEKKSAAVTVAPLPRVIDSGDLPQPVPLSDVRFVHITEFFFT